MSYDEFYTFPNPETSDHQGLLCFGGELTPKRILQAYSQGIFPWYEPGNPVLWWSPNPRLLLIPSEFKLSRSLKQTLKKPFVFTIDTAFEQVISNCSTCSDRTHKTWITPEMIDNYTQLHEMGYAHSFELWNDNELVGGLYGISLGKAFFGESMFHKKTDASKIALYYLCRVMEQWKFDFIDCQLPNKHLISLGAKIIDRRDFLYRLHESLQNEDKVGKWTI
ncbi:leucyl/phenylalanyl-tRNA--protein transferase [Legionella waltersii]|uniref:Leucyl/phenylalanyl-tRNA--protein transferase n=1 Tax=Legionella waltersii TaxID=66969 RepID=A0A0W1AAL8_9GAMM|nr:leucyl/phenylalanyl-tRNA--protein transferase [Legionella waltersii]KTD78405.1 leucyl/phenylalanyl-tRNA--protein transferase [Legionella waltersii]SNV06217.1 leucyl/phenylalanyl-tRNA--protein transferase [Legionella waltersii]